MNDLLEKLKLALKELENDEGDIRLFALFLREDALGKWDLLVSAPWLDSKKLTSYDKITEIVQKHLGENDIIQLARIAILDPNDPSVFFLQEVCPVTNDTYKEVPIAPLSDRFGFAIRRAFVLRCTALPNPPSDSV